MRNRSAAIAQIVAARRNADPRKIFARVRSAPWAAALMQHRHIELLHGRARRLELVSRRTTSSRRRRPSPWRPRHRASSNGEALVERDDAGQLGMLARELPALLQIATSRFRGEKAVGVIKAPARRRLGAQRRIHLTGTARQSLRARGASRRRRRAALAWGRESALLVRGMRSDSSNPSESSQRLAGEYRAPPLVRACACSACSRSERISGTFVARRHPGA